MIKIMSIPIADEDSYGYGVVTKEIRNGLNLAGANMLGLRDWNWDWRMIISTPVSWPVPEDRIYHDLVWHTMFDTDLLPQVWVDILNRVGLIWVPSQWCKEVFEFSGVERPIMVAGYGVDPEMFDYAPRGWTDDEDDVFQNDKYTFLTVCGAYGDRKNERLIRRAFYDLNLPDARLVIKMRSDQIVKSTTVSNKGVTFIARKMSREEYATLLARADCFVNVSSGEGFSLTPLEAMATGLPAIVLDWGGPRDYIDDCKALPVAVKRLVWAEQYNRAFNCEGRWAEPDKESLMHWMRWCYENRDAAAKRGREANRVIMDRYTWETTMGKAVKLLTHHLEVREK